MKKVYSPSHKKKRRSFLQKILLPFIVIYRMIFGNKSAWGFVKLLVLTGLIIGFSGFLVLLGLFAYYSSEVPEPGTLITRDIPESTKIYDRTGEHLLYEISGEQRRTIVEFEELPKHVSQALISIEDRTFYEHNGFNFKRLTRAVFEAIFYPGSGSGASTLTSQLVKNALLTNERSLIRKIKEMILTYHIERRFSKDEILGMYLNEIPYGGNIYGIEAAANYYFDKPAKDLTLEESAAFAGLINRPSRYSPYGSNLDKLLERKDLVLYEMNQQGYISEEEMNQAQAKELVFRPRIENIIAPHFVFYVREQLESEFEVKEITRDGLEVRTTLDLDKHQLAESILKERAEKNLEYDASNASLVAIDPKTGEILTMIGSVDYFNEEIDGQVNVALRPRQPGSSFKPFVYTQAWARGYSPSSILFDVATKFPGNGQAYEPKNYDLSERGPISLRKSLQGSLNITAVKLLYLVGVNPVLDLATKFGYTTLTDPDRFGLSLVLGGAEVKLLEHTAAYATLASEGTYHKPFGILEVKDSEGNILINNQPTPSEALDSNIANITTNVLSDDNARAFAFGSNGLLTIPGKQVAAKTGTTNDYRDAWTMGYTKELAVGVWVGNNDFSQMKRGAGGSTVAAPIWNQFMRQALADIDSEPFTQPNIPNPEKAILSGQGFGLQKVKIDKASQKLATSFTPDSFAQEVLFIDAHTILYYVDKSNPNGPIPSNPANDPQYTNWEEAVQAWINNKIENNEPLFEALDDQGYPEGIEIVYGLPPTEEDDLHVIDNLPSISMSSPQDAEELNQRRIISTVEASAPRGISRVEFYFDNILIGSDYSAPYELNASLKAFQNGFYEFKAIAFDDIDNSTSISKQIKLQSNENSINLQWINPIQNQVFELSDQPIALQFNIEANETLTQVTYFAESNGQSELIEALIQPASGLLEIPWKPTQTGNYRLYTKISFEGEVLTSPSINVNIIEKSTQEETE